MCSADTSSIDPRPPTISSRIASKLHASFLDCKPMPSQSMCGTSDNSIPPNVDLDSVKYMTHKWQLGRCSMNKWHSFIHTYVNSTFYSTFIILRIERLANKPNCTLFARRFVTAFNEPLANLKFHQFGLMFPQTMSYQQNRQTAGNGGH